MSTEQDENGKRSDAGAGQPEPAGEIAEALRALVDERDRLAEEKAELQELLLRRQADHENFRRRVERERGEVYEIAVMDTAGPVLAVLDDFERALDAAASQENEALENYIKGMQLIYQRLYETLKKMGLEPIEAAGKPFDPNLHHAVQMEQREDLDDHTVIEELQKGYLFKGRLLRAAMVKVAVK